MTAHYVGIIQIRDHTRWVEYVGQVGATIAQYGGEILLRGVRPDDPSEAQRVVVLRFADVTSAQRWFNSPEYQRLIPIREAAADVTLLLYQS